MFRTDQTLNLRLAIFVILIALLKLNRIPSLAVIRRSC